MVSTRKRTYAQALGGPSTSSMIAADAVMGVVGSKTAASLATGKRSKKLGAGMDTMVSLTKAKARSMSKVPTRRTNRPSDALFDQTFMPRAMGKAVRKASRKRAPAGSRKRAPTAGKRKSTGGRKKATSACQKACAPSARGQPRMRNPKTCRCVVAGGEASRKSLGVCVPRRGKDGIVRETVLITGRYKTGPNAGRTYTRCVRAGDTAAKRVLGQKSCPAGKVLRVYPNRKVPITKKHPTIKGRKIVIGSKVVTAERCVKARGALKNCPANQVIADTGVNGLICVLPQTAAKRGYRVVGTGTLPVRRRVSTISSVPKKARGYKLPRSRGSSLVMSLA